MSRDKPFFKEYSKRQPSALIQEAILAIFAKMKPRLTVRQIYYALTVRGIVPKTEKGYRQVGYHLGIMREQGIIPYGWIADNIRYRLKPDSDPSLEAALDRMQAHYRRDLWANQDAHLEIWVEKDSLAGVISQVTEKFDVSLHVARGYSSLSFIHDAAQEIKAIGKPAYIYHFGDYDPSGVDAARKIYIGLLEHSTNVHFERVAITKYQIERFKLPTRPTRLTDLHSRLWGSKPSVELDALPAPILRGLVSLCIERHITPLELAQLELFEKHDRQTLAAFRENLIREQNLVERATSRD